MHDKRNCAYARKKRSEGQSACGEGGTRGFTIISLEENAVLGQSLESRVSESRVIVLFGSQGVVSLRRASVQCFPAR